MARATMSNTDNVEALLGGAVRGRTRVRGFAPWQPRDKSLMLLEQVQAALAEYRSQLPITLRQIFYRLVGAHGYAKDDKAAERLGELINPPPPHLRCWTWPKDKVPRNFKRCRCGWSGLPHYRVRGETK